MSPEDRKLLLIALATAIGGSYLAKVGLDQFLGRPQPAYAREFEEAHARAYGFTEIQPDALSEVVAFSVAMGVSTWMLVQASNWALTEAGR